MFNIIREGKQWDAMDYIFYLEKKSATKVKCKATHCKNHHEVESKNNYICEVESGIEIDRFINCNNFE